MDTPQTSSANDIFSLSDHTLADRLQFIEEVRLACSHSNPTALLTYAFTPHRLVTGTGEAFGDVVQNPTLRPNHQLTSTRRSNSPLSSYIGPRRKLPLPEFVRCTCLVHRFFHKCSRASCFSWNEMKVVRSLKDETHPSIISFYSFIITPSYALITM